MYNYLGYIAVYGWCFITAFSMLLTSEVSQRLSPFIVCFFTFSLATLVFLFLNYYTSNLSTLWQRIQNKGMASSVLGINVSTFISWGLMIYPLTYLQPTLVATLILGINPIATAIITRFYLKKTSPRKLVGNSLALFVIIIFLTYKVLHGENSIPGSNDMQIISSLICCYFSGFATSVNNIFSKKIMANDFGVRDVLCLRFYMTIIISGIIGFSTHHVIYNQDLLFSIILTTFVFVVIPLMLLQFALKKLDPLRVAIISPSMPVMVIILQLLSNVTALTYSTVLATMAIWLITSLGTYFSIKNPINLRNIK